MEPCFICSLPGGAHKVRCLFSPGNIKFGEVSLDGPRSEKRFLFCEFFTFVLSLEQSFTKDPDFNLFNQKFKESETL